jgi:hypothetical protein
MTVYSVFGCWIAGGAFLLWGKSNIYLVCTGGYRGAAVMFDLVYTSGHGGVVEIVYVRDMYSRVCILTLVCGEHQLKTGWDGMSGGCRAIAGAVVVVVPRQSPHCLPPVPASEVQRRTGEQWDVGDNGGLVRLGNYGERC